jgi:large subunit ribosomal protein L28
MTGHFSRTFQYDTFSFNISIRSLNHRFLEINFRGNVTWLGLEPKLREIIEDYFRRGKIDIMIDFELFDPTKFKIKLNSSLLNEILFMLEPNLKKSQNIVLNMDSLLKLPGVFNINYVDSPFNDKEMKFIIDNFKTALEEVSKDREKEGEKLAIPLRKYTKQLTKQLSIIRKIAEKQPDRVKTKFKDRLKEIYKLKDISEEKFYEELVYYLDKLNVNEEIERLDSHINYLDELLDPKFPEPVGRKISFLMQECLREINTIGSKSQDKEISKEVILTKELIENIREQILNIE